MNCRSVWVCILLFCSGAAFAGQEKSAECLTADRTHDQLCLDKAYAVTDEQLNQVFRRLKALLNDRERRELRLVQRNWLETRKDTCAGGEKPQKACLIDETVKRISQLQTKKDIYWDLNRPVPEKPFEGVWQQCSSIDGGHEEICADYRIVEEGERLCGHADIFISYRSAEQNIRATVDRSSGTARTDRCVTYDLPYANTNCFHDDAHQPALPEKWSKDGKSGLTLKICNGHRLFVLGEVERGKRCADLEKSSTNRPYLRIFQPTQSARDWMKETGWTRDCLAGDKVSVRGSNFVDQ